MVQDLTGTSERSAADHTPDHQDKDNYFDLTRRFAGSPYGGLTQNNLHLQANPNATGAGGTCFGDSGGPQFWEGTLVIVSITSWGDAICRSNDMTQRLDIPSVLEFLAGFGITPQ